MAWLMRVLALAGATPPAADGNIGVVADASWKHAETGLALPRRLGGMSRMSASVGLTAPQLVAGFAILSGRILPEVLPMVQPGAALSKVHAFVSHGVQDSKLGIHFARNTKEFLSGVGVPLAYHEYQADHSLDMAMISDFTLWLAGRLL